MIDLLALRLLALLLQLTPLEQKEVAVDRIQLDDGAVLTLTATRTADGFALKLANGAAAGSIRPGARPGAVVVTLEKDRAEVDLGPTLTALGPEAAERKAKVDGKVVTVAVRGNDCYVFAAGDKKVLVRRTATATATATAPGQAARVMRGLLVYSEPPRVMSVKAYLHHEFVLKGDDGKEHVLGTSPTASSKDLKSLASRKVELSAVWVESRSPDSREAAPLGSDGAPMKRAGYWQVQSIKRLD